MTVYIHALREEGDAVLYRLLSRGVNISIHALREEGDSMAIARFQFPISFLSTPSARRATGEGYISAFGYSEFLSTPSARRATT